MDAGRPVSTLAVVGGSGGDFIPAALAAGALTALLTGRPAITTRWTRSGWASAWWPAGHFAHEFPLMPVLGDKLKRRFPELRVLVSKRCRDPFTYL